MTGGLGDHDLGGVFKGRKCSELAKPGEFFTGAKLSQLRR